MNYIASHGIRKIEFLDQFLSQYETENMTNSTFVLGWGRKKSYLKATEYAEKHKLSMLCLEDGFIRSLGLGKEGYSPLSLVVDKQGIYFDAFQVSDLEELILLDENDDLNTRALQNIKTIQAHGITKYNQRFECLDPEIFELNRQHILVVDQTFGDQSVQYSGANAATFHQMLKQAILDFPDAFIWVKVHPDVLVGQAKGYFSQAELNHPRIKVLTQNFNPIELMSYIDDVYVVSSQLGFEALLCGKKVHCFGIPWYAGWGVTNDCYAPMQILNKRRNIQRSLPHLFACAYLQYATYVNPVTQCRCELEEILELFIPNIKAQKYIPANISAYGFSRWKKTFIKDFINFPRTKYKFYSFLKPNKNDVIVAWGKKAQILRNKGYKQVITVEDGFIRSIGLGAKLIRPCSLVFDDVGIYYDATRPSRLENLLQYRAELTESEIRRAQHLQQMLIDSSITKYNVGVQAKLIRPAGYNQIILVVGQVEDDMSIQLGGVEIKTNLSLLKTVKERNPQAYIIYKPHPDVLEGLRCGDVSEEVTLKYCDHIEKDVSILDCFNICDEVHTISSLSGFEALLRGLKVYCYGLPFYAGWGLTYDEYSCERRKAKITIEKLLFCTLIEYPLYNLNEINILPTILPENVIEHLSEFRYFRANKTYLFKFASFFKKIESLLR